jgi:subtilase family protein
MRGYIAARARALSAAAGVATITLAGVFAAACSEMPTATTPSPSTEPNFNAAPGGSVRELARSLASRGIRRFTQLPDSTLWRFIEATDSTARVGIKSPGASQGFSNRGKWLISRPEFAASYGVVSRLPGVTAIMADTIIPSVELKLRGVEALSALRRLPQVEFVEPAGMVDVEMLDSGCGYGDGYFGPSSYTPSNDFISGPFQWMGIDRAWQFAPGGRGVMIGMSDTGIFPSQPELNERFAEGYSAGRQISMMNGGDWPFCTHGTRVAAVIAAPMNGRSMVGIAWAADLFSYRHGNDLLVSGWFRCVEAVRNPVFGGGRTANVVAMPWGTDFEYLECSREIVQWYYNANVFFVAAAGACSVPWSRFPSNVPEVLSAGAANWDGGEPCSGTDNTDMIAYHQVATATIDEGAIVTLGQASAGTAVIAGIAALVVQRYPGIRNSDVETVLRNTAGARCGMPPAWDPLLVNAEAAVGGLCWNKHISGPTFISWGSGDTEPYKDVAYSVTLSGGIGPIEITWSSGAVGPTAIYRWPRGTYIADVAVTVRDAGIPFPGYSKTIQVENREFPGGGCPFACN